MCENDHTTLNEEAVEQFSGDIKIVDFIFLGEKAAIVFTEIIEAGLREAPQQEFCKRVGDPPVLRFA